MKFAHVEIDFSHDDFVPNENFNVATIRKRELTFFKLFYITTLKLKVKNMGKLLYLQVEVYISRKRYPDKED